MLREEREARKVGLRVLADKLGILPQLLSVWEKGYRLPSVEDVSAIPALLGVTGEKRDRIRTLARHAREPNWLASSSALTGLLTFERGAAEITTWSPLLIPGLLQTPDYTRAIMDASSIAVEEADKRVRIRLQRQSILTRREPVVLRALIGEWALRENIGNPDIMSDQTDHLLAMAKRPNVSVRIVPAGAGYHPGLVGPFEIYEFAGSPPITLAESIEACAFLHESGQTLTYQRVAKLLGGRALSDAASRQLLEEAGHRQEAST
ncbi:Scr1 family TA system antitoxin-like transcriptional regulator [Amycolatopsis sp. A133]|uniref:Scr1 family TA system antitoxin-like transcriptional regulator n=1 Tax=Amycolatopsis sp. A133 TaxID=3064472 RepID=UPI0027EC994B|nr:Scr1 family TA system antitoxin-like transcriptional regulator [Amycolatopsis sp. A133]MDQ7802436.1 Scr1 family TA system antitoxin-like transcriptional regulator [Amycolatopsis sp. A133]